MTLAHGGGGVVAPGLATDWLYLLIPVVVIAAVIGYLVLTGGRGERRAIGFLPRVGASLERVSGGLPAWSGGGVLLGSGALVIAVIGFLWDVAWHIDFGRDEYLFTPPHTMIVTGLLGLVVAAGASIALATVTRAPVGLSIKGVRVPYSALALGALGVGAVTGFPLDELWHGAYGVDVTMWGPTHLLMIGGASFSPIALWLMITEAGPEAGKSRIVAIRRTLLAGAVLIGLSTFQGEFDFGVPQFQQLYHPVLIALAASIGLVVAREALGPGGALKATIGFIVGRAALALLVGQALNHVIPRFPLYLGAAVMVELVWHFGRELREVPRAILAGGLVGTVGLASEWAWTHVWGWHPWNTTLYPGIITAILIAIPAAILGLAIGRALSFKDPALSARALMGAGAAIIVLLAVPFPRTDIRAEATVTTTRVSENLVRVGVTVDSAAVTHPDWAEVLAWQGGHLDVVPLAATGGSTYQSVRPVPVGDEWKTLVRFARKDVMVAAPVYMPKDEAIGADEVPVVPERNIDLTRDTELLLREAHGGPAWPASVAYMGIGVVALAWFSALSFAFLRVNGGRDVRSERAPGSNVKKRRAPSVA